MPIVSHYDYGKTTELVFLKHNSGDGVWYKITKFETGWIRIDFGINETHRGYRYIINKKSISERISEKKRKGYEVITHKIFIEK